jgi:SWI/SNF-related matrix-associated actin-dependent regulator of chromatin subfamily A3
MRCELPTSWAPRWATWPEKWLRSWPLTWFVCVTYHSRPWTNTKKDNNEIKVEAIITGEKGQFECPARLSLFGPSDPSKRAVLEQKLKADKLVKATQLKNTKAESEHRRLAVMGLETNRSSAGLGSQDEPEVSLQDLLKSSEAVSFRMDGDSIKTLAMSEEDLSKLPMAEQPAALHAQLLPYQLQVCAWRHTP